MKCLIAVVSYHHNNTERIAQVLAKVLDAQIRTPSQIDPAELQGFDLIGFGSGIDSGRNYQVLLDFAEKLPRSANGKAFIFSTNGTPVKVWNAQMMTENHSALRELLLSKGYTIMDEFTCPGLNTNSFLRHFGGINKGRPNAEDLRSAEEFARRLKDQLQ